MGQSPSSEPPKPDRQVVDPPKPDLQVVDPPKPDDRVADLPKLDFRVADPLTHQPTGLALIAHGRNASIDCPMVGAIATCLREKHGCRTVTWSARGVGNSGGTKGPDSKNREDYNVSLFADLPIHSIEESKLTGVTCFGMGFRGCLKWQWIALPENFQK